MSRLVKIAIAAVAVIFVLIYFSPFVVINPGERGVMIHFGKVESTPLGEGLHLRVPFRDKVVRIDVKIQKHEVDAKGSTKDLQNLAAVFAVNFAITPDITPQVYQQQGNLDQVVDLIIAPQTQESFKTAVAQFTAEESIVRRAELKEQFDAILSDRLQKYGIAIYDTSVVNIEFSPEFSHAVEAKQVAEQEAQRAVYIAQKAEQEAKARINQAKGESEAQKLLQVSLDEKVLKKQELDNMREAIAKWDGHLPNVNSGAVPFLSIGENNTVLSGH